MPRLTRLELQGYKTFATKADFHFGDKITCIVGPNGSGKSNLADGLRWVLGEQSFSLLRGRKTEDMIFSGSEQRPKASMAAVTVVFDNSDGWLPIEFSEVSLTRRAYRDGQNEYLLNGQKTRRRDIAALLGKVGLAESTYTIIGQGLVDGALSLKADERRALFEEAIGIGIYRQKREDTLRKLDQTQRNLERVRDILAEIRPRLRALERQAKRAEEYKQVQADLQELLRTWYSYQWHQVERAVHQARLQTEALAQDVATLREQQATKAEDLAQLRTEITAQRAQLNCWHDEAARHHKDLEAVSRQLAVAAERTRNLGEQREATQTELIQLETNLDTQRQRLTQANEELTHLEDKRDEAQRQIAATLEIQAQRETERRALADHQTEFQQQAANLAQQIAELRARRRALQEQQEQFRKDRTELETLLQTAEAATMDQQATMAKQTAALEQARTTREAAQEQLARLTEQLDQTDDQLAKLAPQIAHALAEVERLAARQEVIAEPSQRGDGTSPSWKLSGYLGNLRDLIQVPPEYEAVIASALGSFLQASLVADIGVVDEALQILEREGGRAALLPLIELRPPERLATPALDEFIGWASQLVECAPQHRPAVDVLLGRTAICRTREAARQVAASLPPGALALAPEGEVYYAEGVTIIGQDAAAHTLALAREARQLPARLKAAERTRHQFERRRASRTAARQQIQEQLETARATLTRQQASEQQTAELSYTARFEIERTEAAATWHRKQIQALANDLQQIKDELVETRDKLMALTTEKETAEHQTQGAQWEDLDSGELAQQIAGWRTNLAVATQALHDASARHSELTAAFENDQNRCSARQAQAESLASELETLTLSMNALHTHGSSFQEEAIRLQALIEPGERVLTALETQISETETEETGALAMLPAAERRYAQTRLEYERKQDELTAMQRRIEDDFGLVELEYASETAGPMAPPLEGLLEHLQRVDALPEGIENSINHLRAQMRRMGGINPDVMDEHAQVRQRYDHLETQVEDLTSASAHLHEVIAELDALLQRDFHRTFEEVAKEFQHTFDRLFGGGNARLELTNPDDLTNTGIEIAAQLPGQRQQGLASLSAGERSLTACALIFSLLRVSPTPFVLLDEVDAMLDETNTGRFREVLAEISQTTQFIVISHNRHTVEVAETVYGISLGTDRTSQVISLKLD